MPISNDTPKNVSPEAVAQIVQQGNEAMAKGELEQALECYQQATQLAQVLGDHKLLVALHNNMGSVYQDLTQYQDALESYQQALTILEELQDPLSAAVISENVGILFEENLRKFEEAINFYEKSVAYLRSAQSEKDIPSVEERLKRCKEKMGQEQHKTKRAQKSQLPTIPQKPEEKITSERCIKLIDKGNADYAQGLYTNALVCFKRAIEMAKALDNDELLAQVLNNSGMAAEGSEDYQEAIGFYQEAEKLARKIDNKVQISAILNNMGSMSYTQNKLPEALEYFTEAIKLAEDVADRANAGVMSANLAFLYERRLNKLPEALEYYQKSIAHYRACLMEKEIPRVEQRLEECQAKLREISQGKVEKK